MKIISMANFQLKLKKKDWGPSMTVPDQSMSVKEIMDRYSRGLPTAGHKVPIYEGETFMPDLKNMDLADRQTLYEAAKAELDEIKSKLNRKEKERLALTLTPEEIDEWRKQQKAKPADKPDSTNNP